MPKIAVLVLADTESPGDMGRVVNAMEVAKEFKEAGDPVQIVFDGAGTKWIKELTREDHDYKDLFESVRETISGACSYCAKAYGVREAVAANDIPLLDEFDEHPSVRKLVVAGYQVLTF